MTLEWDKVLLAIFGAANLITASDRYMDWRRKKAADASGDQREVKVWHAADDKIQALKDKIIEDRFLRIEGDLDDFRGEQRGENRRLHDAASDYADAQQTKVSEIGETLVEMKQQIKTLFRMIGHRKGEG